MRYKFAWVYKHVRGVKHHETCNGKLYYLVLKPICVTLSSGYVSLHNFISTFKLNAVIQILYTDFLNETAGHCSVKRTCTPPVMFSSWGDSARLEGAAEIEPICD